jgi:hypothetical protein
MSESVESSVQDTGPKRDDCVRAFGVDYGTW